MRGPDDQVLAVITPRLVVGLEASHTRSHNASAILDDARFIAEILVSEGFELLNFHPIAISFAAPPATFERFFGFLPKKRTFACGRGCEVESFDVDPEDAHRLSSLPDCFDGRAGWMALARPPRLVDDSAAPARGDTDSELPVWSLSDELAMSIWADGTRTPGATGRGVVAAQIGTGHYRHRFFSDRGYRVLPTLLGPGQRHPQRDDHGQGTGEAASLFGAAPDIRLRPVKGLLDPIGDLLMTIDSAPTPDLIINSWGYGVDHLSWHELDCKDPNLHNYLKILASAIAFATASGIVVCAAAPSDWKSFPACHPDVMAITAVTKGPDMPPPGRYLGASSLYPGRMIPDIWSDATKSVRAGLDLIGCTHPAQPGSALADPGHADVSADEGFAWCDIEQAASPLAVGRLSLLLEQHRGLSPAAFKAMVSEEMDFLDDDDLEPLLTDQAPIKVASLTGRDLTHLPSERPTPADASLTTLAN